MLIRRCGFTLTEVLVTISVVALVSAILLPAISSVRSTGLMAESMNNMRQIALLMDAYSQDHRQTVLPSQFNYQGSNNAGLARSDDAIEETWRARGTWADILWTIHGMGDVPESDGRWRFDSPNKAFYETHDGFRSILRSAAANTDDAPGTWGQVPDPATQDDLARPYGDGAQERHLPGYFAANNYFNADPMATDCVGHLAIGQIRLPAQSLYLVDSLAGEVIEDEIPPFSVACAGDPPPLEVDFRYDGACLILFLDGHVRPEHPWQELPDLRDKRGVHVRDLAKGVPSGMWDPASGY